MTDHTGDEGVREVRPLFIDKGVVPDSEQDVFDFRPRRVLEEATDPKGVLVPESVIPSTSRTALDDVSDPSLEEIAAVEKESSEPSPSDLPTSSSIQTQNDGSSTPPAKTSKTQTSSSQE